MCADAFVWIIAYVAAACVAVAEAKRIQSFLGSVDLLSGSGYEHVWTCFPGRKHTYMHGQGFISMRMCSNDACVSEPKFVSTIRRVIARAGHSRVRPNVLCIWMLLARISSLNNVVACVSGWKYTHVDGQGLPCGCSIHRNRSRLQRRPGNFRR